MMSEEMLDFEIESVDVEITHYVKVLKVDLVQIEKDMANNAVLIRLNDVVTAELTRLLTKRTALMKVRGAR